MKREKKNIEDDSLSERMKESNQSIGDMSSTLIYGYGW